MEYNLAGLVCRWTCIVNSGNCRSCLLFSRRSRISLAWWSKADIGCVTISFAFITGGADGFAFNRLVLVMLVFCMDCLHCRHVCLCNLIILSSQNLVSADKLLNFSRHGLFHLHHLVGLILLTCYHESMSYCTGLFACNSLHGFLSISAE